VRPKKTKMCSMCNKEGQTDCDHCGAPVCRECSQIVVKKPTDNHVYIYHRETCVPRKNRKKRE